MQRMNAVSNLYKTKLIEIHKNGKFAENEKYLNSHHVIIDNTRMYIYWPYLKSIQTV